MQFKKLLLFFLMAVSFNSVHALDPDPKFDLRLTNRNYISSNEGYFDIVLKHTNPGQTDFRYTGGQYVIILDTVVESVHLGYFFSKDTSTYGTDRIPPKYVGALTKVNDVLKLDFGQTIPVGSEPVISATTGTLVARIRFFNPDLYSNSCLLEEQFLWKTRTPGEFTKLYFRKDGMSFLINNSPSNFSTYDLCMGTLCCLSAPLHPPVRISPLNNSENLNAPVTLVWQRGFPVNYSAHIQVASDSDFNFVIYEEYLTAPNGTSDISLTLNTIVNPGSYYWRVKQGGIPPQGAYNEPWKFTISPPVLTLKLTVIPEGLFRSHTSVQNEMIAYLRNSSAPFQIVDSCFVLNTDSTFENELEFEKANSGKYYIVVRTPNTLETWSKAGGDSLFRGYEVNEYDFSIDSSHAYNCNLTLVENKYCMYSGDVNQDEFIDANDILTIYNESYVFTSDSMNTDLSGDGITDLNDLIIGYNNSFEFISVKSPLHNMLADGEVIIPG